MSAEQNKPIRIVKCPQCKTSVEWGPQSPYRPFCSERCKLIDTGAWAEGAYRIASQDDPDSDIPEDAQAV